MSKDTTNYIAVLVNSALIIAVASALISVCGLQYQMGYFRFFGINPVVAGIDIDTLTLTNGGVVPMIGIVLASITILLVMSYYKGLKTRPETTRLIRDICLIAVGGIILIVSMIILREKVFDHTVSFIGGLVGLAGQLAIILKTRIRLAASEQKINKILGVRKPKTKEKANKNILVTFVIGLIGVVSFTLIAMSATQAFAINVASNQKEFIVINDDRTSRLLDIAIARAKDGIIVVQYSTKDHTFLPGYRISTAVDTAHYELRRLK